MSDKEFWEYVEIEGLEYFLIYKTNAWHHLENQELLAWCYKYVETYHNIMLLK